MIECSDCGKQNYDWPTCEWGTCQVRDDTAPIKAENTRLRDRVAVLEKALNTARSHIVTLGGNPHPHDLNADQIQVAVLATIYAALTPTKESDHAE